MEIHERLAAARKAAGYESAADAARALGASYPTYAGHENGSSGFKHKTAVVYARKFRISLEWLLTGRGTMSKSGEDADLAEIIQLAREVDHACRADVLAYLRARKTLTSPKPPASSQRRPPSTRK